MTINFTTPVWLIRYYYIVGTVSLIINFGTSYLVIAKSEKIDGIRYLLLVFQFLCTITNINFTLLMQPMSLFPIMAAYCNGVLVKVFNIYSHYLLAVWTSLLISEIVCLTICFAWKHRKISKLANRLNDGTYNLLAVFAIFIALSYYFLATQMDVKREFQMQYVREMYPDYYDQFQSLKNFVIYTENTWATLGIITCSIGSLFCGTVLTYTTIDMLKILKKLKMKISSNSYTRYKNAVKSLLAHFYTSLLSILPVTAAMIVMYAKIENGQDLVNGAAAIGGLHSSVNAVVLITFTIPYRKFVIRKSAEIFGVRNIAMF
ncbi:Serpentine Receptor, class I [Caenorhabditis elegans]|uniref:Serpentine Receptor, class I n=1 Tax=Caenorhabditis elegans TaxID=6239 RepID=O44841_CAEEL|nr:Serpentine Receptor, class I [Caenorhabditis elegans]CCD68471.1 Serpentine Receptor, class I [Caenorhabditis elegans]|eukprot:NP_494300.1 Serpentine Receptor, class I [Caenorhabditis elegans]